jgi:hypothetical protein
MIALEERSSGSKESLAESPGDRCVSVTPHVQHTTLMIALGAFFGFQKSRWQNRRGIVVSVPVQHTTYNTDEVAGNGMPALFDVISVMRRS